MLSPALAVSLVDAGAVTQGYKVKTEMASGTIVSIASGSSDTVEKSDTKNESDLVGVIAAEGDSLIDLRPAGSEVRVAVSGDTSVLVSDINGEIKEGDQIAISPLAGVGMKLSDDIDNTKVVATASQALDKVSSDVSKTEVEMASGAKKAVTIGRISVNLLLNDRASASKKNTNFLSSVGEKITGKQTDPVKVIASTAVSVSTLALAGMILNGSVKGSFISLGRNPLSKESIINGLLRAVLLAIVIIAFGLSLSYMVLLV